jgi:hypothetical protein
LYAAKRQCRENELTASKGIAIAAENDSAGIGDSLQQGLQWLVREQERNVFAIQAARFSRGLEASAGGAGARFFLRRI